MFISLTVKNGPKYRNSALVFLLPGKITHPSGAYYEGDLFENMMHGNGKYVFIDKSVYNGQFFENK